MNIKHHVVRQEYPAMLILTGKESVLENITSYIHANRDRSNSEIEYNSDLFPTTVSVFVKNREFFFELMTYIKLHGGVDNIVVKTNFEVKL